MKKTLVYFLVAVLALTGCVSKVQPPAQNTSASLSDNITSPWPHITVYSDENTTVNVTFGQGFVIRYDFFNSINSTFQVDYQPADVLNLVETQLSIKPLALDGTEWFLFQAADVGNTNVTIGELSHLMPAGFVSQKTFTVRVEPPTVIVPGSPTGNPWPDVKVFSNLFSNQNPSLNVTVGQEFVIPYSQFTASNVSFQPPNVVIAESRQFVQNPSAPTPDGITWILYKAVAEGSTNVSVTETTRFRDPMQTKTLTINVSLPQAK